ncbi:hypothetical protein N7456_000383 [Penicillium angulare]|uniref:Amino acid transporter transmembrane domain-containing protein n=1 Tax=Penicillium angulare TaxID=116970 RepID=A0A9W9GCW3_9EURO|nr:hypothetical protein N7456_000383 [Penicillium angulare]
MSAAAFHDTLGTKDSKDGMPNSDIERVDTETASQQVGQVINEVDATGVGVFGAAAAAGGEQFRVLGKWKAAIVLIHTEVGIGILSLPSVFQKIGLIPGLLAILGVGTLSTWTAYVMLLYWRRYPHIDNLPDALRVLSGNVLAAIGGVGLIINLSLACSSATLAMSVALNTLTGHRPATIGIFVPIFIVIMSLAVDKPQTAPEGWNREITLWATPSFQDGFTALLSVCYAFGGRQGFLMIMAEMKDPNREYVPSLVILQAFAIPMYLITGGAIYGLAGDYVTSPAIGTAPILCAKIAYGILLLTLFATGLFYGHAGIKYLFTVVMCHVLKSPEQMTMNSFKSWTAWIVLTTFYWILVFILANAIPVFNSIIAVSSALFVAWFSFGFPGAFWLHLNWKEQFSSKRMIALACLSWGLVIMGAFLNTSGIYASIDSLVDLFNNPDSGVDGPFTCADNSVF